MITLSEEQRQLLSEMDNKVREFLETFQTEHDAQWDGGVTSSITQDQLIIVLEGVTDAITEVQEEQGWLD